MGDIVDGMFQDGLLDWYPQHELDEPHAAERFSTTCRNCGAKGLWWFPVKRGTYHLMNPDGSRHNNCRPKPRPDDMEDLYA